MNWGLLLIALILSSYITVAATVSEFTFSAQGYKDFYINSSSSPQCTTFEFLYSADVNGEQFYILSLGTDFGAQPKNASELKVSFNNTEVATLGFRDFTNKISRLEIPAELVKENNSVKVCGKTTEASPIIVYASSKFGVYSGAHFPPQDGFRIELETYTPYVGVPFTIDAVARNFGNEDAQVTLTYRKAELEEKTPEISVLKGDTTKSGIAPKCRERDSKGACKKPGEYKISYEIVANKAVPFTLLPAAMTFVNSFGEEEVRLSQRPSIAALEPPHKIAVNMVFGNDKIFAGEKIPLHVRVQNISDRKVEGITVSSSSGLEIIGDSSRKIASLEPGETTDLIFTATSSNSGNYAVFCKAEYEGREIECETTSISVQQGIDAKLILSVLLAFIAAGVFAYIYFKKQ